MFYIRHFLVPTKWWILKNVIFLCIFFYFWESLESIDCGDLKSLNGEAVYVDVAVTTRPYKATCMQCWGVQRGEEEDQKNREWCTYVKAHETTQLTLFSPLIFFSSDTVVPVFHLIWKQYVPPLNIHLVVVVFVRYNPGRKKVLLHLLSCVWIGWI